MADTVNRRTPATVLVVEDETAHTAILAYNLDAQGYAVVAARAGDEALSYVREKTPDLVLLDWMVPNVSGIEVCRQLKSMPDTRHVPVIMISARAEEADTVRGLETGADDYLSKPYSIKELMARIRTQLRRTRSAATEARLVVGDLQIDLVRYRAYRNDRELHLKPIEFRLLTALMERPGRVWSRTQLLDRVWGHDICADSRTVDVHIGRLRKSIACPPLTDQPIRTVRGVGYVLG